MLAILAAAVVGSGAAANPITVENALPGSEPSSWVQPNTPPAAIAGYASEISLVPGQTVHLHVSTAPGDRYRIELYRLGYYGGDGARLQTCIPDGSCAKGGGE